MADTEPTEVITAVEILTPRTRFTAASSDRDELIDFLAAHIERNSQTTVGFRFSAVARPDVHETQPQPADALRGE
jgi:hypothetical protein